MLKKRKGTKQNHPHQIEIDVILCRKKLRINFQPLVSLYANWLCAIDYMANVPFSLYLSRKAVNWYVTGEWFFTFLLAICGVCVCVVLEIWIRLHGRIQTSRKMQKRSKTKTRAYA